MKPTLPADVRSPSQLQADAAAAAEDWQGFTTEVVLDEDGAHQILEHCRNLAKESEMDQTIALGGVKNQPFRWKDKVFRILRCEYVNGEALVEVVPHDAAFIAEVKRRVQADRFHTLTYYQGFGFICFPEDYQQYQ
jgi:hypothetical protein